MLGEVNCAFDTLRFSIKVFVGRALEFNNHRGEWSLALAYLSVASKCALTVIVVGAAAVFLLISPAESFTEPLWSDATG